MMRKIIVMQSYFFFIMIGKRFGGLLTVCVVLVILLGFQSTSNMDTLSVLLTGTSFADAKAGYVDLPNVWLVVFTLPTVIIGPSFEVLWRQNFSLLRGQGYTGRQFGVVNVWLMLVTALCYVFAIGVAATVTDFLKAVSSQRVLSIPSLLQYLDMVIIIFGFLLITQLVNWRVSRGALLVVPVILVATLYASNIYNPVNLIIKERAVIVQAVALWAGIFSVVLVVVSYIFLCGRQELK